MQKIEKISSGSKWEDFVGYSRAVKIGNLIEVAGTTAHDGNKIIGIGNAYEQTKFILQKMENTLSKLGAKMENTIRTRMYVTDISKWEEIGKAHGEVFKNIKPVSTMIEAKSLISPEMLVEIELTAII